MEKLFNEIAKVIAHPHTTITEHDRERAAKVLLLFDSHLKRLMLGFEDEDCPSLLFGDHAQYMLEGLK